MMQHSLTLSPISPRRPTRLAMVTACRAPALWPKGTGIRSLLPIRLSVPRRMHLLQRCLSLPPDLPLAMLFFPQPYTYHSHDSWLLPL
jgi:hypothetical protein